MPATQTSSPDKIFYGLAAAAAAYFLLAVTMAFSKELSSFYSAVQIAFFRNAIGLVLLGGYFLAGRKTNLLKTQRPAAHVTRGLVGTLGLCLTFAAFAAMPMAETTVFLFSTALLLPVLSIVLLKEYVGPYRWAAIVTGFCGVAVMAHPSGAVTGIGAALALSAAFVQAVIGIHLRWLGRTENPLTIVFYFVLIGMISTCLVQSFMGWEWEIHAPWLILGVGVSGTAAQILLTAAYKYAPPAAVAPLNYTGLIWASLFDIALWGVVPGWPVFAGGLIVTSSNLFILWRERVRGKQVFPPSPVEGAG